MEEEKLKSEFLFNRKQQLFLNFINHTDQADNAVRYIGDVIPEILDKIQKIYPIQYLDIGCGYGYKTQAIIDLIKQNQSVNTTAIDPSSELLSLFKDQSKDKNIDFVCSTWEDYQPQNKFHIITSIHTFYYIDNWRVAINKMLEHLDDQGIICIAIRSNDQICQFKNHFFNKIYKNNRNEHDFDELCDTLNTLGVNYKTDIVESQLNINDTLELNEKGKQLIEFLLRTPYTDLDSSIQKEINNYLEKNQHGGYLTQQDGFAWIMR